VTSAVTEAYVRTLAVKLGAGALCALLVAGCGGSSASTKDSPGDTPSGSPAATTGGGTNNGVTGGY
jgi:hypothetical protein